MAKNMAKKPAKKGPDPLGPALQFFLAGFVAECVLLVIYNFFINANSTTFYPMYYSLQVLQYAGPVAAAAGAVLLLLKKCGKKLPLYLIVGGLFFGAVSVLSLQGYWPVITALCVLVPIAVVYVLVFFLFPREFFYECLLLGGTIFTLWVCRKGVGHPEWNNPVITGVFVVLLVVAGCLHLTSKAQKEDGLLKLKFPKLEVRLFAPGASYNPLYACGVLASFAMLIGVAKVSLAFYAIWVVAIALFALAVYYVMKLV